MAVAIDAALQQTLDTLEVQRKIVASSRIKSYIFIGGGLLIFALGFLTGDFWIPFAIAGTAVLVSGIVIASNSSKKFSDYRHNYKQQIVVGALKLVGEGLEIDYTSGLTEQEFVSSQLFSQNPDRYASQDHIFGSSGKTKFSFSEVHAEYKTETQTKNGRQTHWHTILKGIVFCADFNKNFQGATLIRAKDAGSAFGAWLSEKLPIFSSSNNEVVRLESITFNKEFIVYSTDQIEARYILTPSMMERLCALNAKCANTISLSFINSVMYVAFPLTKDYFEPPVFKTLLNPKILEDDLKVIQFMYDIVQELDLNTRIWGKN